MNSGRAIERKRQSQQEFAETLRHVRQLEEMRRMASIYRSHPRFQAPADFARAIRELTRVEGR